MNERIERAKPRLGFLGVGGIGRNRMEAIRRSDAAEIAAICDTSRPMIEEAAKTAPEAALLADYEDMLRLDLGGIVIATPNALRAEHARSALKAGKAVFCQGPLGRDLEEVRSVLSAARDSHRLLGVDLSYRHTLAMKRIRDELHRGSIGAVYCVDLAFHHNYGHTHGHADSGGGCVMDLGAQLIDLALWALDFPLIERISSRLWSRGKPLRHAQSEAEDYAVSTLVLEGGAALRLACSWRLSIGQDAVIEASFHGTEGGLSFRNVNGSFFDFAAVKMKGDSQEILTAPPDFWDGRAAVFWADRLAAGHSFDAKQSEEIERVAEAVDRIYEPE